MKIKLKLFSVLLVFALVLCACTPNIFQADANKETTTAFPSATVATHEAVEPAVAPQTPVETAAIPTDAPLSDTSGLIDETLQVIVFDVGQADCALVLTGEHAMLIDAGNLGQDSLVLGYLSDHGVRSLDYLVQTHPHSDHIGSMPAVIRAMDSIGTLIMPDAIHTTKAFEHLLDAVEEKNIEVAIPLSGDVYELGNAKIQVLAPNSVSYNDLNNYSVVLRIVYGQTVFLFTGDAQEISENEQLMTGFDLSADVLKVGHHGSHTSTTPKYIEAITPSYAVISCGKDNSYGHPHSETITRLIESNVKVYRTDENGTVAFTTDGQTITASMERDVDSIITETVVPPEPTSSAESYIGNRNSKIFHLPTCSTLPAEKNRLYFTSRDEAVNSQYRPCQRCNP